jgi:hypothetical protein
MKDKDKLCEFLFKEIYNLKNEIKNKDINIEDLTDQLEYVKNERNENIFQVQNILKDIDLFNKLSANKNKVSIIKIYLKI